MEEMAPNHLSPHSKLFIRNPPGVTVNYLPTQWNHIPVLSIVTWFEVQRVPIRVHGSALSYIQKFYGVDSFDSFLNSLNS